MPPTTHTTCLRCAWRGLLLISSPWTNETWTNIQGQMMLPGKEVRVYFKPWGKATLPSRKKKDKFFWKAMVMDVPEAWTAASNGQLNLALKVHRPPVVDDERGEEWAELRKTKINASQEGLLVLQNNILRSTFDSCPEKRWPEENSHKGN